MTQIQDPTSGDPVRFDRRSLLRAGGYGMVGLAGASLLAACDNDGAETAAVDDGEGGEGGEGEEVASAPATGDYSGLEGRTIGLFGVAVSSEAPARVAAEAERLAEEHGFSVEIYDGDGDYQAASETMRTWAERGVDAMISDVVAPSLVEEGIEAANNADIPVGGVFAGYGPGLAFDVASNEWISSARVGSYLFDRMGGEGGLIILNWPNVPALRARQHAIEAMVAFSDGAIEVLANEVLTVPGQVPDAMQKTEALLTRFGEGEVKAIFAGWDEVGVAASDAAAQLGRDDVFVVSIDGNQASFDAIRRGDPFAATCANDMESCTQICLQQLGEVLGGGEPLAQSIWVDAPFVSERNLPEEGTFPEGEGVTLFWVA